jgi:hypothetical protein
MASSGLIGYELYSEGRNYANARTAYAEVLSFENRLLSLNNWLSPDEEWLPKKSVSEQLVHIADESMDQMRLLSGLMAGVMLAFFALVLAIWRHPDTAWAYRGAAVLSLALTCLVIGLFIPMLEIIAYSQNLTVKMDHPVASFFMGDERVFTGDTVHFYQNKSVIQLIGILFKSGNLVVGTAILLFSVVIPATKLLSSYVILFMPNPRRVKGVKRALASLGKWSMADVFVASCFLAFLSFYNMSTGVETNAVTLPGLYYFLAYVILGLLSSRITDIVFKRKVARLSPPGT